MYNNTYRGYQYGPSEDGWFYKDSGGKPVGPLDNEEKTLDAIDAYRKTLTQR